MAKLSTNIILILLGLKNVRNIKYNPEIIKNNDVYVFDSRSSFNNYFLHNGIYVLDKSLLNLAVVFELKNGDIVAFKSLCDQIIFNEHENRKNIALPIAKKPVVASHLLSSDLSQPVKQLKKEYKIG